jgi:hypothetical protein
MAFLRYRHFKKYPYAIIDVKKNLINTNNTPATSANLPMGSTNLLKNPKLIPNTDLIFLKIEYWMLITIKNLK